MGLVGPGFVAKHHIDAVLRLGDVDSHWCDRAEHVSGLKIVAVLADLTNFIPVMLRSSVKGNVWEPVNFIPENS